MKKEQIKCQREVPDLKLWRNQRRLICVRRLRFEYRSGQ